MKISTEEVGRIIQTGGFIRTSGRTTGYGRPAATPKPTEASSVEISDQAKDVQLVKNAVAELPDVRESQVEALKARIESGTYNVSSQDVADLIVRRTYADSMQP